MAKYFPSYNKNVLLAQLTKCHYFIFWVISNKRLKRRSDFSFRLIILLTTFFTLTPPASCVGQTLSLRSDSSEAEALQRTMQLCLCPPSPPPSLQPFLLGSVGSPLPVGTLCNKHRHPIASLVHLRAGNLRTCTHCRPGQEIRSSCSLEAGG